MLSKLLLSSSGPVVNTVRQISSLTGCQPAKLSEIMLIGGTILVGSSLSYAAYDSIRDYDDDDYVRLQRNQIDDLNKLAKRYNGSQDYPPYSYRSELEKIYDKYHYDHRIKATRIKHASLKDIYPNYITPQLIIDMVSIDKFNISLSDIPNNHYSQSLFDNLARITGSLRLVPKEYQTKELCHRLVKYTDRHNMYKVVESMLNPYTKIFMDAIKKVNIIEHIKPEFRTKEMWELSVERYPETVIIADDKFQTEELWAIAINKDAKLINRCSTLPISKELWTLAISKDASLIRDCKIQSEELWTLAISKDANLMQYCTLESEELWLSAIKVNPHLVHCCKKPSRKMIFTAYSLDASIARNIKDPDIKREVKRSNKWSRQRVMDGYD